MKSWTFFSGVSASPLAALVMFVCYAGTVKGMEWGDLKMRFVVAGRVMERESIATGKDEAVCGKEVKQNPLLVGENSELGNVVVFLVPKDSSNLPIHDDYKRNLPPKVEMKIEACEYKPRIAFLQVGQSLIVTNGDRVGHNTVIHLKENRHWSSIIPTSNVLVFKKEELARPEKSVVEVVCSIHPWMVGYLLVQDHPYMTASDVKGEVLLKNIPVGRHKFKIWHEISGGLTAKNTLDSNGKPVSWVKGNVEVEIHSGKNDLGEFKVRLSST